MSELLPCPFCGGEAKFNSDDDGWNWIVCSKCGCCTDARVSAMDDCRPLLAETWNSRAAMSGEPVGEITVTGATVSTGRIYDTSLPVGTKLYAAPQPAPKEPT